MVAKAADWLAKDIVGQVIVDGRDFANQDVLALAPEGMPDIGVQRHAFTRIEFEQAAGLQGPHAPVAGNAHFRLLVNGTIRLCHEQFQHQLAATTIDDVFGLDVMPEHRR